MINVEKTHDEVRVSELLMTRLVLQHIVFDFARLFIDMCENEKCGYYHVTNKGGDISWYDFCVEFYNQYSLSSRVIPFFTEEFGLSKATRPVNSRLDKLVENGFKSLPTWQDAVRRYLEEAKF